MKKLLSILATSALAASAFGQGTVVFINNTAGLVRQWTSASDTALISTAVGNGRVELFTAPAGTSLTPLGTLSAAGFAMSFNTLAGFLAANPGWSDIGVSGAFGPAAGRFNGGTLTLPGVAGSATAQYVIIGWNGTATTFDQAVGIAGTFFGTGPLLTTLTGNPATTPPGTATPLSATFTGLTMAPLTVVPEPTSFALAGLGLAALLVLRRRS